MTRAATTRPVIDAVVGELRPGPDGTLTLPELGRQRLEALLMMAAHHPDEAHGAAALADVLRVALALAARAPKTAEFLRGAIRTTPGALARLDRHRRGVTTQARFRRQLGEAPAPKRAPRHDAPAGGLKLSDLGRDLHRPDPAELRARRSGEVSGR